MGRLGFFIKEAFRAMRRNGAPSMAAIVTTIVTMVLLGVLIPIFQSVQAKGEDIREQLAFRVAMYDDATPAEIKNLREELAAIPHVESLQFVSKKEALDELSQSFPEEDRADVLGLVKQNPLPRNFIVKADDAQYLDSIRLAVGDAGDGGLSSDTGGSVAPTGESQYISPIVQDVFDRNQAREDIEQATGALKLVLTILTALMVAASLMLVGNTIRLSIYARRREVEVMRLVGATRWFIRWPFMIEGMVVGFVGGVAAILILWLGKATVVDPLSNSALFSALQTMSFPVLVAILFCSAIVVSAVGSGVTLRRFLRV
jgi:cell division transport system permease protein